MKHIYYGNTYKDLRLEPNSCEKLKKEIELEEKCEIKFKTKSEIYERIG